MQTTNVITASEFVEMRTTEAGDRYLVVAVTYDDLSQEEIVLPIQTVVPA